MKARSAAAVAEVQSPVPAPSIAAAPEPADELASLETKLEGAISRERELGEKESGLQARQAELVGAIGSGNAQLLELKRRLATGEDVTTELESGERTVRGFERQREGVESFLADAKRERATAEAEVGRLSEDLSSRRLKLEVDKAADAADAADVEVYELAAKLIRAVIERERLVELLCDRFREAGGLALFNSRILSKRDDRRRAPFAVIQQTGRGDLSRLIP